MRHVIFYCCSPDALKSSTGEQLLELQGIFLSAILGCGQKRLGAIAERIVRHGWTSAKDDSVSQIEALLTKKLDSNLHVS